MGFLDIFRQPDMDRGVDAWRSTDRAVLLDVRTPGEYREGRVPGSVNLPLRELDRAEAVIADKDTPIFVYCRSGARSSQAARLLKNMGYTNVTNIGGILAYTGKVER